MNTSLFSRLLTAMLFSVNLVFFSQQVMAQSARNIYRCQMDGGKPITSVKTKRGIIRLIIWESDFFRDSGWTPQKRCQEVSTRFQQFSDEGNLKYVTTGVKNNLPIICVGKLETFKGYVCMENGLLLTLQPNDNANEVLKNLFSKATRVNGSPIVREPNGRIIVSIEQFLEKGEVSSNLEETPENTVDTLDIKPIIKDNKNCPSVLCE